MNQFPIIQTIKNSFTFIFEHPKHALKVTWPYALIMMVLESIVQIAPGTSEEKFTITSFIFIAAFVIIGFYATAIPCLAWQRAYLNGISPDNQPKPLRLTRDELRFIAAHALIYMFFPVTVYLIAIPPIFVLMSALTDSTLLTTILFLIALPLMGLLLCLTALCTRFLVYLPAIASGNLLKLKEAFRLTKGGTLRLMMTGIIIVMLFSTAYAAIYLKPMIEDGKRFYEYGYQDEKLENEKQRQIAAGEPVTVPENLPNKEDFADQPPTLIDFLFYIPAGVILNLISVLIGAGILAQFYKWAMERRT